MSLNETVLACPMIRPNDANAETVRDYLKALLLKVWEEAENFSGKRPFGNSGWEYEVYESLGAAGIINTSIDDWDDVVIEDPRSADQLILDAIKAL